MFKKMIWVGGGLLVVAVAVFGYYRAANRSGSALPARGLPTTHFQIHSSTVQTQLSQTNPSPPFSWEKVASKDYKRYLENLRALEVPEPTLVDILVPEINRDFVEKALLLKEGYKSVFQPEFWTVFGEFSTNLLHKVEGLQKLQALEKERLLLLRNLLGSTAVDPFLLQAPEALQYKPADTSRDLAFLPPAKQQLIQQLIARAREKTKLLRSGPQNDAATEALRHSAAEFDAEFKALLTPEENLEYDARLSRAAQQLRFSLFSFQPTRGEFIRLVAARKAYLDEFGNEESTESNDPIQQLAARKRLREQISTLLGEDRYALYEKDFDLGYRVDRRFLAQQEASPALAETLYSLRARLTAIVMGHAALEEAAALTALQAIRDSARTALGQELFQRYESAREGSWLKATPPPPAPTRDATSLLPPSLKP